MRSGQLALRPLLKALPVLLALVAISCTDAGVQPKAPEPPPEYDNRMTISGEFCTAPDAQITFPVKVLFVLDQSTSLQFTDMSGLRFTALNGFVDELLSNPAVSIGFVGFAAWSRPQTFTRDRSVLGPFLDPAGGLGEATDYQGALASARKLIEQDILATTPAERALTQYVLVMLTDGTPTPVCRPGCEDGMMNCTNGMDDDGDGMADGSDPDCADLGNNIAHPENQYPGCNTLDDRSLIGMDELVDLPRGRCPGYNQPETIQQRVTDILELANTYSVGAVKLNSVLLLNPNIPEDVRQIFLVDEARARALLQGMAQTGNGTYRDANLSRGDTSFLRFDIRNLQAPQVLTSLIATNQQAALLDGKPAVDSDGDGLADVAERQLQLATDTRDTDGDNYGDLVELRLARSGFDPSDATSPAVACPDLTDTDHDRVLDCEERALETDIRQADSDGDGIGDWLEIAYATDPTRVDADDDPDFDRSTNREEIAGGTDPFRADPDRELAQRASYALEDLGVKMVTRWPSGPTEERHCYRFRVENIRLVQTASVTDPGLNRIIFYAHDQPAQVSGSRARTYAACIEVLYEGMGVKDPPSGEIDVSEQGWYDLLLDVQTTYDSLVECPWFDPATFSRPAVDNAVMQCLDAPIEVGPFAWDQAQAMSLLRRYVSDDNGIRLPQPASELFVPIETFDPAVHCQRPTNVRLLNDLVDVMMERCSECPDQGTCCGAMP